MLFTFPQKAKTTIADQRNLLMQKQVRLRALDVIIFKPPARPPGSKLISKVGTALIEYSKFVQEIDVRGQ